MPKQQTTRTRGRHAAAPFLVVAALLVITSCSSRPDARARAAAVFEETNTWKFRARIEVSGSTPTVVEVEGSVRKGGDLYASLVSGGARTELLRTAGKIWTRRDQGGWELKRELPSEVAGVLDQSPSRLLVQLNDVSTEEVGEGWIIEGKSQPSDLGLKGASGEIPVTAELDSRFVTTRLSVGPFKVRAADQAAGDVSLRWDVDYFDLGGPVEIPAPPS